MPTCYLCRTATPEAIADLERRFLKGRSIERVTHETPFSRDAILGHRAHLDADLRERIRDANRIEKRKNRVATIAQRHRVSPPPVASRVAQIEAEYLFALALTLTPGQSIESIRAEILLNDCQRQCLIFLFGRVPDIYEEDFRRKVLLEFDALVKANPPALREETERRRRMYAAQYEKSLAKSREVSGMYQARVSQRARMEADWDF